MLVTKGGRCETRDVGTGTTPYWHDSAGATPPAPLAVPCACACAAGRASRRSWHMHMRQPIPCTWHIAHGRGTCTWHMAHGTWHVAEDT